jgi:hypothetical protein
MSGAGYDVAGDSCSWNIDTSRVAFHGDGARRVVLMGQGDTAIQGGSHTPHRVNTMMKLFH